MSRTAEQDHFKQMLRYRHSEAVALGDLTEDFRNCSFSASKDEVERANEEAWLYAIEWKPIHGNVYIEGPVGTGKTYMGRCLLRRQFSKQNTVAEVSARRIVKVAATFAEGKGDFERWKRVHFLLLDDIDKIDFDDRGLEALWELLDARAGAKLRTIFTSNIQQDGLEKHLSNNVHRNFSMPRSIIDRMKPLTIIHVGGESRRGVA